MPGISEGDLVVTPGGRKGSIASNSVGEPAYIRFDDGSISYLTGTLSTNNLVKINDPIRVRVDSEWQAEALVSLAEELGADGPKITSMDGPLVFEFYFDPELGWVIDRDLGKDLTFVDDLPQITAWVKYHGESEDEECERCGGNGIIVMDCQAKPCPNCTDDSEDEECERCGDTGSVPRSEDDYPDEPHAPNFRVGPIKPCPDCTDESEDDDVVAETAKAMEEGLCDDDNYSEPKPDVVLTDYPLDLEDYLELDDDVKRTIHMKDKKIDDLEQELSDCREELEVPSRLSYHLTEIANYFGRLEVELQDCWENQQEYKDDVDRLLRENAELQEELDDVREEARRDVKELRTEHPYGERQGWIKAIDAVLEILTPDSDEGDGECE